MIFGGQAGGWPAGVTELVEDVRRIEYAPIEFEIAAGLAHWRVEVPAKARACAEALTGPTTPEGARVQIGNAIGAEVGPGQIATWRSPRRTKSKRSDSSGAGSADPASISRFGWSGPDEA